MSKQQATLRDFLLPRNGPGTRTAWFVFFSTVMTALAMCCVAMHSWYRDAQSQISKTHPVVLEWSAESVLRQLDRARDEISEIAQGTNPTSNNAALDARLREFATAESLFSGFVYLDGAGDVRASKGLGAGYQKLMKALVVKRAVAVNAELSDVLAGGQLRREFSETREPSLRVFTGDDEHAWVIASAPLTGHRKHGTSTLHALLRGERLAEQLHADLLTVGGLSLVDSGGRIVAVAGDADSEGALPKKALQASTTPHLEVPWTTGGDWTVRSAVLIDALDLTIAANQPVLMAFKPMLVASSWILATGSLMIATFTLLACLSAMASTRRLQTLLDGFRKLLDDDFEVRLPLTAVRGQVEHLYRAFNAVAERVSDRKGRSDTQIEALSSQNQRFQLLQEQLAKLSVTDGLTDLHNHRYFQDQLAKEIKRLARSSEGLSILILDIDDFKKLNDNYGHAAGDEFLKQLALILRESVRDTDVLARYGGEEFVVIATGTKIAGAQMLAEKLRTTIAETSFIVDETMRPRRVTVSIGVAEYVHSRTELFTSADAALYQAKNAGKNCVMLADGSDQLADPA
jgi:diguanylate cyclase (GGDEF)-like protein